MPHQCLKCGKVFPSGSPEILKGCNDCGGKKFFYTEEAVSEEEREHLIEQANKDIKVLIREILSQSQRDKFTTYDSEGRETTGSRLGAIGGKDTTDWVKISPEKTTKSTSKETEDSGTGSAAQADADAISKQPTVKEILNQLKEKSELGLAISEKEQKGAGETTTATGAEDAASVDTRPAMTRPRKKGKVKLKRKKVGKKKRSKRPEVIRMEEPGVYDISLAKLLKGFPIIINKDGTYLVHLPSVFEKIKREKKS